MHPPFFDPNFIFLLGKGKEKETVSVLKKNIYKYVISATQ